MRISDWSSDVCSADLIVAEVEEAEAAAAGDHAEPRGSFTVTAPLMFGRIHVAPVLQIGRASCRERVCQYGYICVAALPFTQKQFKSHQIDTPFYLLSLSYVTLVDRRLDRTTPT